MYCYICGRRRMAVARYRIILFLYFYVETLNDFSLCILTSYWNTTWRPDWGFPQSWGETCWGRGSQRGRPLRMILRNIRTHRTTLKHTDRIFAFLKFHLAEMVSNIPSKLFPSHDLARTTAVFYTYKNGVLVSEIPIYLPFFSFLALSWKSGLFFKFR